MQRGMDSVGSNANAPKASARRASGLAAEMLETESVGSRFSNRYEEDLEMGSPSPSRQHRARSAGNGGAGRNSRRVSRSGGGGGASIASRSHYYGESDDDSYVDEEVRRLSFCGWGDEKKKGLTAGHRLTHSIVAFLFSTTTTTQPRRCPPGAAAAAATPARPRRTTTWRPRARP